MKAEQMCWRYLQTTFVAVILTEIYIPVLLHASATTYRGKLSRIALAFSSSRPSTINCPALIFTDRRTNQFHNWHWTILIGNPILGWSFEDAYNKLKRFHSDMDLKIKIKDRGKSKTSSRGGISHHWCQCWRNFYRDQCIHLSSVIL